MFEDKFICGAFTKKIDITHKVLYITYNCIKYTKRQNLVTLSNKSKHSY